MKELAENAGVVVVVGSENSSNSQRLRECAEQAGAASYLVDDPAKSVPAWIGDARVVGVTAGASSPETLVQRIVERIQSITGQLPVREFGTTRAGNRLRPAQ